MQNRSRCGSVSYTHLDVYKRQAASFKHVSPAGAALGLPLDDTLKKMYFVEDIELSPLALSLIHI